MSEFALGRFKFNRTIVETGNSVEVQRVAASN